MVTSKKPASKSTTSKSTKTTSVKSTSSKTPAKSTAKTTVTKSTTKPVTRMNSTSAKAAKKANGPSWKIIIAIIAVVALIAAAICIIGALASKNSGGNQDDSSLTIENGKGEKIAAERVTVADKKFSFLVPTDFKKLSAEQIAKKYSGEVPGVVYSKNADKIEVDLAISTTNNEIKNSEIKDYLNAMEGIMKEVSEVIDTNYYDVSGHNIASLQLVTDSTEGKMYNHMIFFSYEGKLVLVSFNCANDQREAWEKAGDNIINSLEFAE